MSGPIVLDVVGVPQPQGSKTGFVRGGRVVMTEGRRPEARDRFKDWRGAITGAARDWLAAHPQPPIDEPVRVTVEFRFDTVISDRFRTLHTTRPDLDKLTRTVLDALVAGGLLRDDSLVCTLEVSKRHVRPEGENTGCTVRVDRLGPLEAATRERLKAEAAEQRRRARQEAAS